MKQEAKNTPGPWRVSSVHLKRSGFPTSYPHYEITADSRVNWIAHVLCFSDANKDTEYEANAELIARAPDLLRENEELREKLTRLINNRRETVTGYDTLRRHEGDWIEAEKLLAREGAGPCESKVTA